MTSAKSFWRAPHGTGANGRMVRTEGTPSDELSPATPGATVPPHRDAHGRFAPGNTVARARRRRVGRRSGLHLDGAMPAYAVLARWSARWVTRRLHELHEAHGAAPSEGVEQLVEDEAAARRAARLLEHEAARTGDAATMARAVAMLVEARTWAKDAWELHAREAAARRERGTTIDVDAVNRAAEEETRRRREAERAACHDDENEGVGP